MIENDKFQSMGWIFEKMPDDFRVHIQTCDKCMKSFENMLEKMYAELNKILKKEDLFDPFMKGVKNHIIHFTKEASGST